MKKLFVLNIETKYGNDFYIIFGIQKVIESIKNLIDENSDFAENGREVSELKKSITAKQIKKEIESQNTLYSMEIFEGSGTWVIVQYLAQESIDEVQKYLKIKN